MGTAVGGLETTVGDSNGGLVKDVADLENEVNHIAKKYLHVVGLSYTYNSKSKTAFLYILNSNIEDFTIETLKIVDNARKTIYCSIYNLTDHVYENFVAIGSQTVGDITTATIMSGTDSQIIGDSVPIDIMTKQTEYVMEI